MRVSRFSLRFERGAAAALLLTGAVAAMGQTAPSRAVGNQQVEFQLYMPLQNKPALENLIKQQNTPGSAQYHQWLTPAQFKAQYGPSQSDIAWATNVLGTYNLKVAAAHSHGLRVVGAAADVENALGVRLFNTRMPSGVVRVTSDRPGQVPSGLSSTGAHVIEFTAHQNVRPQHRVTDNFRSPRGPYYTDDLKQAYDFPSIQALDGTGATIAILVDGDFIDSDMTDYFSRVGLPVPNLVRRTVDGGAPVNGDSVETNLDIQQSGGMAPGATIIHYNIPDLADSSIYDGYVAIVDDDLADVVNSSFGGGEFFYTEQFWCSYFDFCYDDTAYLFAMDDVFAQGNAQGITFVASSGDEGALIVPNNYAYQNTPYAQSYRQGPEWPAVDPHVTGVGGTNLTTVYIPGSRDSSYVAENAFAVPFTHPEFEPGADWGSGGGISLVFPRPDYQQFTGTLYNNRTVPDVAGHEGCCPGGTVPFHYARSADYSVFGGELIGLIGTSASSPDFVGLLALKIQNACKGFLGSMRRADGISCSAFRLGNENYDIYSLAFAQQQNPALGIFRNDIPGWDGYFFSGSAGWPFKAGYSLVTGNGSVDGRAFIGDLNDPPAGIPGTASNP